MNQNIKAVILVVALLVILAFAVFALPWWLGLIVLAYIGGSLFLYLTSAKGAPAWAVVLIMPWVWAIGWAKDSGSSDIGPDTPAG